MNQKTVLLTLSGMAFIAAVGSTYLSLTDRVYVGLNPNLANETGICLMACGRSVWGNLHLPLLEVGIVLLTLSLVGFVFTSCHYRKVPIPIV